MNHPAKFEDRPGALERLKIKHLRLRSAWSKIKEKGSRKISFLLVPHDHEAVLNVEVSVFMAFFLGALSLLLFLLASAFVVYMNFFFAPNRELIRETDNNVGLFLYYNSLLKDAKKEISGLEKKTEQLNLVAWDEVPWKRILTFDYVPEFSLTKDVPESSTNMNLYQDTVEGFAERNIELFKIKHAFQNAFDYLEERESILYAMPRGRPLKPGVGFVTSTFGGRVDPFGLVEMGEFHSGIDFAAGEGIPIYATAPGIIEDNGQSAGGLGKSIRINHLNGFYTVYGHCSVVLVTKGQLVNRGELIGHVGSTGKATGPHVHYEVHIGYDPPMDPAEFVNME
ncbi:M23 family metallopeptidase [Leptospira semungkisensis]|uniref:M23 family metallopeptidase n=1 Tax=Leptospira semungkisensis TaxID=2484985 RepID=A0A4R9FSJ6_9LEPT|nr:M23 family metallopeptidase [Leptospira semungkisensis]TGK00877.1 M23 family metallopeptidase [Leptospira semungkisensis]